MRREQALMLKEQQEDSRPGEEPAANRVARDDARKAVGPQSWRTLRVIVRTLDFKPSAKGAGMDHSGFWMEHLDQ